MGSKYEQNKRRRNSDTSQKHTSRKAYSPINLDDYVVVLTRRSSKEDEAELIKGVALKIDQVRFRKLFRYASTQDFILYAVATVFSVINAFLLALLVYVYYQNNVMGTVLLVLSSMFALSTCLAHLCSTEAARRQLTRVRLAYFNAALEKDYTWFDCYIDRDLPFRMLNDITELRDCLGKNLPKLVYLIVSSLIMISMALTLHAYTTFLCIVAVPFYAFLNSIPLMAAEEITRRDQKAYEVQADSIATGILANIRLVREYQTEEKELSRFTNSLASPLKFWWIIIISALIAALHWFLPMTIQVVIIAISATSFDPGYNNNNATSQMNMTETHCRNVTSDDSFPEPTRLSAFLTYVNTPLMSRIYASSTFILYSYYHLSQVYTIIQKFRKNLRTAAEAFFVIDWKSKIDNMSTDGVHPHKNCRGKIVMTNVHFSYPRRPDVPILSGVHLTIKGGQMVTIFGPSDSGKTTVVKLILRLYDVRDGKIKLDGKNIKTYNVRWYRSQFGAFKPDTFFNTTIEENLRYCKLNASFDEIVDACKMVGAHEEIQALHLGYKTLLGVKSKKLVDNRLLQKLVLAQAILRKPRILILYDGYISTLDEKFETIVLSTLLKMRKEEKCTIILTSNKINSIVKACDSVFPMKNGRIFECGAHSALMKKRKRYYRMVEESLEETEAVTPYFTSQLANYKFAEAIRRLHRETDAQNPIEFSDFHADTSILESVYFRHVSKKIPRIVQSRPVGCYSTYTTFILETDTYYYDKAIRSNLLRERDLRLKKKFQRKRTSSYAYNDLDDLSASSTEITGDSLMSIRDEDVPSPFSNDVHANLSISHSSILKPHIVSFPREDSDEISYDYTKFRRLREDSRHHLIGIGDEGDDHEVERKRKPKKIRFRERSLSPTRLSNIELDPLSNSKLEEYFASLSSSNTITSDGYPDFRVVDDRLRHYFGWTVNGCADNESINSDESHSFWEEYSLQLQIAVDRKMKLIKLRLIPWALYSWPFMIVTCVTCSVSVYYLVEISYKLAIVETDYIKSDFHKLIPDCVEFVKLALLSSLVPFCQELILGFGSFWVTKKLRILLLKSFLYRDLEWYDFLEHDISFLTDSIACDTASLHSILIIGTTSVTATIALTVTLGYNFHMAAKHNFQDQVTYLLIFIPWIILARVVSGKFYRRYTYWLNYWLRVPAEIIFDSLTNVKTIIVLGLQDHFSNVFQARFNYATRNRWWLFVVRSLAHGVSEAAIFLGVGFWIFVCDNFERGQDRMLPFIFVMNLIFLAVHPTGDGIAIIPDKTDLRSWASRMTEDLISHQHNVLNEASLKKLDFSSKGDTEPEQSLELRLENVKFAYALAPEVFVLNGITANFPAGKYTAIVGPANSGKSSIVGMLLNLYCPTEGRVLINDMDYNTVHRSSFKNVIGSISRDPNFMQHLTVAQNIMYGNSDAGMEKIQAATRLANIDFIIDTFPKKYDTKLEDLPENSDTFVFRQRLAIARTAVQNPKIVIVDDATVSIDSFNNSLLIHSLMNLREGRTFIVASRRITPVRNADSIIVLQNGYIVEEGSDEELRAKQGFYYHLLVSQILYETNETYAHERKDS